MIRFRAYVSSTLLAIATAVPLFGQGPSHQSPDLAMQKKAIADIAFMSGTWAGEGWRQVGPTRQTFTQSERVAPFLGGGLLLVEGRGVDPQDPSRVLHHAFAVLSWNETERRYDFRSYAGGRAGTFVGRLIEPGVFVWEIDAPGQKIRYTIRVAGETWTETGAFSADGATWREFFSMTLRRTGPATFDAAAVPAP